MCQSTARKSLPGITALAKRGGLLRLIGVKVCRGYMLRIFVAVLPLVASIMACLSLYATIVLVSNPRLVLCGFFILFCGLLFG